MAMVKHLDRLFGALKAKEEVDRLSQLTKDRSTLAFGSAMVCIVPSDSSQWLPKGFRSLCFT